MKNLLLAVLFLTSFNSYSQSSSPCSLWPRYDQEIFPSVDTTYNVIYGSNSDYQGVNQILKMDIYQPSGDTLSQRPLIIFAHGGSFVAGDKANTDQINLCTHFAKRGYVTATINYRLGMFPINGATATDAVYRACQDMKAAIRFFRKDAATTNLYNVDPTVIFIGGTSAGAFTALHTAYMNTYAELPATIDTSVIGNLEGNSGNPGYSSEANAVINLCGALGESSWIVPGDIPLCSMHGTADGTVPYSSQMLYLFGIVPIMVVDGSYAIHNYINTFSHPATMYTWYGADHVPYDGGTASAIAYLDTTLRFVSNFLYTYSGCIPSDPNPLANTVYTTTGIGSQSAALSVTASSPASDFIRLNHVGEKGIVRVYDEAGRKVTSLAVDNASETFNISCSNYQNGIYAVHYETVKGVEILKVVVCH
ncbi:MAG: carboxylesterase family protein [Bacteroidota bacterium]